MEKFLMLQRDKAGQRIAYVPYTAVAVGRQQKGVLAMLKRMFL